MKSRQRLLAALRHEPVDRVPWTALITDYYLQSLPESLGLLTPNDILKYVGADILDIGWSGLLETGRSALKTRTPGVEIIKDRRGDIINTTLVTPIGSVSEQHREESIAATSFRTRFFIQNAKDCEIMRYMYEHRIYEPDYAPLQRQLDALGDDGVFAYWAPRSPLQMLLEELAGLETTVFLLADHLEVTENLLTAIHEANKVAYRLLAESPAEFIVSVEDTSTTMISPRLFEEYVMPFLNDYSAILHSRGKIHGAHMCGHLSALLGLINQLDLDGIESLTPFPTGDTDLAHAKAVLEDKFIIGGLDAPSVKRRTAQEIKNWVKDILSRLPTREGIVLEVTDDVSYGTPLENLRVIGEIVEEYG